MINKWDITSTQPVGSETARTPLPPSNNSEGEYIPTSVSTGKTSHHDANTVEVHHDLNVRDNVEVLDESFIEHLLRCLDYYPSSDENETFPPSIYFEFCECAVFSASKIDEQRGAHEQHEA